MVSLAALKKIKVEASDTDNLDDEHLVILVFKDEEDRFLDARLVTTPLSRCDIEDLVAEYNNYSVSNLECRLCKKPNKCSECPSNEFDVDDFLDYTQTFSQTTEVNNSGIVVYNNIKVNTTKGV